MKKQDNYDMDFTLLDLEHIEERFELKNVRMTDKNTLFVTSKFDEWYVEYSLVTEKLVLHHKNKKHVTKRFHKENMDFYNIFQVFGYIRHHDGKIFNRGNTKGQSRLMQLLEQIS